MVQAVQNLIQNEIEDRAIGKGSQKADKGAKDFGWDKAPKPSRVPDLPSINL